MALQDFINANNGRALDYDGWYGAQCVDLIQFWSRANGKGSFSGQTALSLTAPPGWTWVANTPQGVPPAGAVVKFNYAPVGHVAIARAGGNTSTFPTFEQNWNGHRYCEQLVKNYNNVIGWWVLNNPVPTPVASGGQRTVPIKASVNVRTQPNTTSPIAGALRPGYCTITGETQGGSGTVNGKTSTVWYRTLNGNWFNAAATL